MKKFFLGACLLALTSLPARAQTGGTDVVVVRISGANSGKTLITTSFGANSTQVKEVNVLLFGVNKSATLLAEATQQALAPLFEQGYTLKGMSGGDEITLIVLTKPK